MRTTQIGQNGEEWGPWIMHHGKWCPLQAGTIVEVVSEDRFGFSARQISTVQGGTYSSWNWENFRERKQILRHREKKPKGLQMLESNLLKIDAPTKRDLIRAY